MSTTTKTKTTGVPKRGTALKLTKDTLRDLAVTARQQCKVKGGSSAGSGGGSKMSGGGTTSLAQ